MLLAQFERVTDNTEISGLVGHIWIVHRVTFCLERHLLRQLIHPYTLQQLLGMMILARLCHLHLFRTLLLAGCEGQDD